jgi:hypothetical protein
MRFSIHAWWTWLFCSAILAMAAIASAMFQDDRGRALPIITGAIASVGALLCGGVGVVLLVKWMIS